MSFSELSLNSFYRAAVFTCAAVNASVCYFVAAVFFDDSFYRAGSSASAAFYANILINLVHFFSPRTVLINAKKPLFLV